MKSIHKLLGLFAVLILCGTTQSAFSQDLKDFFNNSQAPMVYLGVDFSRAKLINDPGANTTDIKNRLYHSINQVIVDEMERNYNVGKAFDKVNVGTDISGVEEQNEKVNASEIASSDPADFNRLKEADISAMVKKLGTIKGSGIGVVFIMEGMKKEEKKSYGSVWVALIDVKTKKLLMAERMEEEAAGFGFRNFWASIIKRAIQDIDKKKYKEWKKTYGK